MEPDLAYVDWMGVVRYVLYGTVLLWFLLSLSFAALREESKRELEYSLEIDARNRDEALDREFAGREEIIGLIPGPSGPPS